MSRSRQAMVLLLRMALACIAMSIAYLVSTLVVAQSDTALTPEEAKWAGQALFLVSSINALALSYPIFRSRWRGLKLIGAVGLIQFGVETFMTQIETLYFNHALQMATSEWLSIVAAGALRALVFAPLAALIFDKIRKPTQSDGHGTAPIPSRLGIRVVALALFYVVVYFMFGYFVAWQSAETRMFYSGTTAIKPFVAHFEDFFRADPAIIPFQVLRGALWTALAYVIARVIGGKRWEASLAVALIFAALLSSGVGLFPNPYMPAAVRQSHFIEIVSSMLLFGGVAGWVLRGKER